ncbi:carbohydrate ABC transporter permease [Streptomyces sp. NPDC018610]|uniref:carbohydrate ABC transporter permease n=1 Tax=Streptomyces sp. NPDC018610 TaxID=3365049 RepID=UPI00379A4FAD
MARGGERDVHRDPVGADGRADTGRGVEACAAHRGRLLTAPRRPGPRRRRRRRATAARRSGVGVPFNTTILYSGLQDIPAEIHEAARLDGAGPVAAFRHVTWPLLRPVAGVVLVLGAVYTLRALDVVLVLTGGGPAGATETLATRAYELSFRQFAFGEGAAMGNVLIVLSLAFALLHLRAVRRARDT